MPGGRTTAGVSAVCASDLPIGRPSADRSPPRFCNARNSRKRYAPWLGVAGVGQRIARARIAATGNSFAPYGGPEIDLGRSRAQRYRAMALREITEASAHGADPVEGLGIHRPQHCSVASRIRRARCPHFGRARVHAVHSIGTTTSSGTSPRCVHIPHATPNGSP